MSADVRDRLLAHKSALELFGVMDVASLPTMTLTGEVMVNPAGGLTSSRLSDLYVSDTVVASSWRPAADGSDGWHEVRDTRVRVLGAEVSPVPLPLPSSYWAAQEIHLAPGTVVLLPYTASYLTVLCERLVIGDGVVFTWQRPPLPIPADLTGPAPRPGRPDQMPDGSFGAQGEAGWSGGGGNRGAQGAGGPQIELWALTMLGRPAFDVRGQDGGQGGRGQPGGGGGRGGRGQPSHSTLVDCRRGPGYGGRGGNGGQGGPGGAGGDGGTGGKVRLFMPSTALAPYLSAGFVVEVSGGATGRGGDPGAGGQQGQGGEPGRASGRCRAAPDRRGEDGDRGLDGPVGTPGHAGAARADAIQLADIDAAEFRRALTAPAITHVEPEAASVGDHVVLSGLRFLPDDELLVNGESTPYTSIADTMLQFVVPETWGGTAEIRLRQTDTTLSNPAGLLVLPILTGSDPTDRIVPGNRVALMGSGFARDMRVYVDGEEMHGVSVASPGRLDFTVRRPAAVRRDAVAEVVDVSVTLPTGQRSPGSVRLALDTYRIAVLGDSVAWGQGLREDNRTSTLVARSLDERWAGSRGVYVDSRAHSGAPIGVRIAEELSSLPGEVPTSFPTILQQVAGFTEDPDGVDLVLISGGINDINVRTILNPMRDRTKLLQSIERACRDDMTVLLERTLAKFSAAKVVVTGYFPIVSKHSDLSLVQYLMVAMTAFTKSFTPALLWANLDRLFEQCALVHERMNEGLQAAVDAVAVTHPGPRRVGLAAPPFTSANAALAPDAWLFGLRLIADPLGLNFGPEDDPEVAGPRAAACAIAAQQGRTELQLCKVASVGHPNPVGAGHYARAVVAQLEVLESESPSNSQISFELLQA